jgi:16S rRNA (guanine966-N2)-methyltransferase
MVDLAGCRFADLYAGCGAVGLEAASRGAVAVLLVESDTRAVRAARANIASLGLGDVCRVHAGAVNTVLAAGAPHPYDVVFADPPYALEASRVAATLAALVEHGWLAPAALVVLERSQHSPEPTWPDGLVAASGRRYGETVLWYGRRT